MLVPDALALHTNKMCRVMPSTREFLTNGINISVLLEISTSQFEYF